VNMAFLRADAMEEIYHVFKAAGGKMVGHWPTEGYQYEESKVRGPKPQLLHSRMFTLRRLPEQHFLAYI